MSGNSGTSTLAALWDAFTIGTVIVLGALVVLMAWRSAAAMQANMEQRRAAEMLSESRALCEKWGLAAGTLRFNECLADIQTVRDRQVERIREDDEPL
jgi:ubiquinone biosynthesis protein UbiJ